MLFNLSSIRKWLTSPTAIGVRLWVLIVTFVSSFLLLIFILTTICYICYRRRKLNRQSDDHEAAMPGKVFSEMEIMNIKKGPDQFSLQASVTTQKRKVTDHFAYSAGRYSPEAAEDGRRRSVSAREEIELATNGFGEENVISIEDYGVDYFRILSDDTKVTIKRFNANKSFDAKELIREAERIRHISHKNLVKLLYCTQGTDINNRTLVYENVDNGNLHQWLHGYPQQPFSPLTWPIRMNIIQGIAKGLAYLHEDVEPQILHGNLKSSSILLDQQWNPKIADFGLVKLFGSENLPRPSIVETLGYESFENGSNSTFTEKNDVYNFGILVMEMITGKTPVDCNQSQPYLIEWVKSMIGSQQAAETVDSKLEEKPSSKELKRLLLIALRCVDPEMEHRPKMAHILHMLEPRDLLLSDGHQVRRGGSRRSAAEAETSFPFTN